MISVNAAGAVVILMEYAEYGSLKDYVEAFEDEKIPESQVLQIML